MTLLPQHIGRNCCVGLETFRALVATFLRNERTLFGATNGEAIRIRSPVIVEEKKLI